MKSLRFLVAIAVVCSTGSGFTQSCTWLPTGTANQDWTLSSNWSPSTEYPNAPGVVANVNNDITGNQTIALNQEITVGVLNLGASSGTGGFTIAAGSGTLVFNSGVANAPAQINLNHSGTWNSNTISAPVLLLSDLDVDLGGISTTDAQRISFTGAFDATGRTVTFTGGILNGNGNSSAVSFSNLIGDATTVITNSSNGAMAVSSVQTNFYGKFILNGRAGGSNTTTLSTGQNGSVLNASEIVLNGYFTSGDTQWGGAMQTGQGSTSSSNPGQRLTQNTMTFNGGYLNAGGQQLDASVINRVLRDDVSVFNVNSGYSIINVTSNTSATLATQRLIDVGTLNRTSGATFYVRGTKFNDPSANNSTTLIIGNGNSLLVGAGGSAGGTEMSIIPWMVAKNTSAGSAAAYASGNSFATYLGTGVRALEDSEYAGSVTAGATHNVSVGSGTIAGTGNSATVNSLRITNSSVGNIGSGNILNVTSGGVIFSSNNGGIGVAGSLDAGTISFGSKEAVIWANASNVNRIGAIVAGAGGFTKAGTGTLHLTAMNSYTGRTYVSAGTLVVGDGTNASRLGVTGDVGVASGATLTLMNGMAIADTAIVTLENFGLYNGMLNIDAGINETIGALYLGDQFFNLAGMTFGAAGTGADFECDQWFAGDGIVTLAGVIPEPSTLALLGLGAFGLLGRRRR